MQLVTAALHWSLERGAPWSVGVDTPVSRTILEARLEGLPLTGPRHAEAAPARSETVLHMNPSDRDQKDTLQVAQHTSRLVVWNVSLSLLP